ncbi:phage tail protein [Rubrivivax sp. RP6-9]|uniref:phage tail protein n=1 Tax=Rubrivivax sp. RP6-9 TaxID=3415750 RepID=UPI003CC67595
MPNSRQFDHRFNGRFRIEIEGVTQGAFAACDGLEVRVDVVDFNDGDDGTARKRPGRTRYGNIVLRRGSTLDTALWDWFKQVADGRVERKAGSVIVCNDVGDEVYRYNFFEGWPCRWKSLELDAQDAGTLIEEIEIAVEKIERG